MDIEKQYISFIIPLLEQSKRYKETCELFCTKFNLTKVTFVKYWKLANVEHSKRLDEIKKESDAIYKKKMLNVVRDRIKGVVQQKEELSSKIDELERLLSLGTTEDWRFFQGKPVSFTRPLNLMEIARISDTILKHRQELNKLIRAYEDLDKDKGKVNIDYAEREKILERRIQEAIIIQEDNKEE